MFDILSFLQQKAHVVRITEKEIFLSECPWGCKPGKHESNFSVARHKPTSHCFKCGRSARWTLLVSMLAHVPYHEAQQKVEGGLDLTVAPKEEKPKYELHLPPKTGWTRESENYLLNRGLSRETINRFGLYWCTKGFYARRIIIPAIVKGEIITFQARAIDDNVEPRYRSPKNAPKSEIWFNLDTYRPGKRVVIVEGPFDVMRLWELGTFAICPFGKNISEKAISILTNLHNDVIYLCQDQDTLSSVGETWRKLSRFADVRILPLFKASDPGEATKEQIDDSFINVSSTAASLDWNRLQRWREQHGK